MITPPQSRRLALRNNSKDYIYFSPATRGASGRAVKIHKDLFLSFFCAVDPSTYDGLMAIRHIEQLKTTPNISTKSWNKQSASHLQQMQNIRDSFQRTLMARNIQVFYSMSQEANDPTPVLYITNFKTRHRDSKQKFGLYLKRDARRNSNAKLVKVKNTISLDGYTIYINGLSESTDDSIKQLEQTTGSREKQALFYTPASVCNEPGIWNSTARTDTTRAAIKELTAVIKKNRVSQNGISWIVEGEACAMLSNALENLSSNLSNHSFKIINPVADTPKLIQNIASKKGNLTGEFFDYSRSRTALTGLAIHKEALKKQIGLLPGPKNYDKITRKKILSQLDALGRLEASTVKLASRSTSKKPHSSTC